MKRRVLLIRIVLLIFWLLPLRGVGQSMVRGKITNEKGEALGFASVWVSGTQQGTTSNEQGLYELKLKKGTYEISYQYIGYNQQTIFLSLDSQEVKVQDIGLKPSTFQLKEVMINATAEDPAFPIMRHVIARRAVHLHEVREFQCRVYMKGLQRLTAIPKRVMLIKIPETVKPGIVYLSESLSDLSYKQPDRYKERMISSKVSGNNRAFSFNQASALQFSLYENILPSYGLNERGFISPLASNAFFYYKYKLIGESIENGFTIYKIQLLPIRKNDPVFKGYIYIVKDLWRLYECDLMLDKGSNIEFVDTLYIKQTYARQPGGVWAQISQRLIFEFEILGFRGNGYFVSVFSNYKVNSLYPASYYAKENASLAANLPIPQVKKVESLKPGREMKRKLAGKNKQVPDDSSLFAGNYFTREVMSVDRKANKTNDSIWNELRPIPLSEEEVTDYHTKDSIEVIESSRVYKDSIDSIENKADWSDFLLTGYTFSRSYKKQYFSIDPVLAILQYNSVEGFVVNPRLRYTRTLQDRRNYSIVPNFRYGFSSRRFYANLRLQYLYDAFHQSEIELEGGLFVAQYNPHNPVSVEFNTFLTLMEERNYMKLYQKGYIKPQYKTELVNGLTIDANLEYSNRVSLENTNLFKVRDFENRRLTSNLPVNVELPNTYFQPHRALIMDVSLYIVFAQEYATRPNLKINYGTDYPRVNIRYKKGLAVAGSKVDFDLLKMSVDDGWDLKLFGEGSYDIHMGSFLNANRIYFPDFQHFNGNLISIVTASNNSFQLLDYYRYSTMKSFAELHADHHFNGFFFNKIPFFRKLKWQEVLSFNYLKTTASPHYMEGGIGIEHIFKIVRVDYYRSWLNGSYTMQGFRFGFGF